MTRHRVSEAFRRVQWCAVLAAALLVATACAPSGPPPDLGAIYNDAAQNIGDERHPVIVIPGILGSKLETADMERPIWGAFVYGAADPDTAEGARLVALPMRRGAPLDELRDDVVATEVLDTLTLDVALIRGVQLSAYVDILRTLAVGDYADQTLGESGAVDYAGAHYNCFQFPYDWRRDVSEQAALLHDFIQTAIASQPPRGRERVDVVAHSMGGLVLRYYLRYGPDPLPHDGSLPELDWEGARYVEHAIMIGTPSAGSVLALEQLVDGVQFASFITPTYRPAVLGTMPAIYQLLPRTRHARVVIDADGDGVEEPVDLFDPAVWEAYEWGLADPDQARVLRQLLPDAASDAERRAIAADHLRKALARAEQLHRALDVPAAPPPGSSLHLVAGDARRTPTKLEVHPGTGGVSVIEEGPGDNTVSRASALMDERVGMGYKPRLRSPMSFDSVQFLTSDHLGLTRDPLFANFVLYTLLERPRE
jgi:pimeloyl-ACP methyl ester carboxylesterase